MAYADYMCASGGKRLFEDEILAYKYGPIVASVYDVCKRFGYREVDEKEFSAQTFSELPVRSRILFADSGFEKCLSVDGTIENTAISKAVRSWISLTVADPLGRARSSPLRSRTRIY